MSLGEFLSACDPAGAVYFADLIRRQFGLGFAAKLSQRDRVGVLLLDHPSPGYTRSGLFFAYFYACVASRKNAYLHQDNKGLSKEKRMLTLILALERDPHTLCAFRARWRVTTAAGLLTYLRFLIALGGQA